MKTIQKVLTLVGDPNQVTTRGGQPFFFLQAGKKMGFFHSGLELNPHKLRLHKIFWNLWLFLTIREKGGFQYSEYFLKQLFNQVTLDDTNTEIISYFPLLPPYNWRDNWLVTYYIDATLKQNFDDYGLADIVSYQVQDKALQTESNHYLLAERIICRSRWAAASVINDYGISANKVHVVLPGASIDEKLFEQIGLNSPPPLSPLRLGFIGMEWQRKRLPFLLQVAEVLAQRSVAVEVLVIGPKPQDLPNHPLLKPIGFIDKQKQMTEFIQLVQSFHFGCLFSGVEGLAQSILESLRLGVPVLGANAGGIPDGVPEGLGFLFELDSPPELVADLLESFVNNPSSYQELRQRVIARAEEFSWQNTVRKFIEVWQGSKEFLYDPASAK